MGYRSDFKISVKYPEEWVEMSKSTGISIFELIQSVFIDVTGYKFRSSITKENNSVAFSALEIKWYDWDTDLVKISTRLPELEITATMDGEDPDDYREIVAKNGMTALSLGIVKYWDDKYALSKANKVLNQKVEPSAKHFILAR